MADVAVCLLVHGNRNYYRAARQAVFSVMKHSDFDIFVAVDSERHLGLRSGLRLRVWPLPPGSDFSGRAGAFLKKFRALAGALEHMKRPWLILLDADTLMVRDIQTRHVEEALDGHGLGMVEQSTILGSNMTREDFLQHYVRHTLTFMGTEATPPLTDFRYFNSGVVLGRRRDLKEVTKWALQVVMRQRSDHQVGKHMIADQDYFQYWSNSLYPGSTRALPWYWNHCEHWDDGFPRPGALVLHFSNFCLGPFPRQVIRMLLIRRFGPGVLRLSGLICRSPKPKAGNA